MGENEVISGDRKGGAKPKAFSDDEHAWHLFRTLRWKDDICCLYCECDQVKRHSKRGGGIQYYRCKACGKNFTDATGTIFHRLRIPLSKVFYFAHLLNVGTPVNRIHKRLGIAKSAAFRLAKKLRTSSWYDEITTLLEREKATGNITARQR